MAGGGVVGAEVVVVGPLSPGGCNQRGYGRGERRQGGGVAEELRPCLGNGVALLGCPRGGLVGLTVFIEKDLPLVVFEPPTDIGGHTLDSKGAGGGIAQDGEHAVVGRNQDEALAVGGGEDIELGVLGGGGDVLKR